MSRTTVVRRLTAIVVLLAILGFSLPATAAPGPRHSSQAVTAHAPGLLDQLLAWIGGLLPGHSSAPQGRTGKTISTGLIPSDGVTSNQSSPTSEPDRGSQIDPNG